MTDEPGRALLLSDLIALIRLKNPDLPPRAVDRAVRRVFSEMVDALAAGGRVELRNVGVLEVRRRDGGVVRDPRTGASSEKGPWLAVHWRTGRGLNKALNGGALP